MGHLVASVPVEGGAVRAESWPTGVFLVLMPESGPTCWGSLLTPTQARLLSDALLVAASETEESA